MESNGRLDGDRGDLAEKIDRDFIRARLVNVGDFLGLSGGRTSGTGSRVRARGGKSSEMNKGVTTLVT